MVQDALGAFGVPGRAFDSQAGILRGSLGGQLFLDLVECLACSRKCGCQGRAVRCCLPVLAVAADLEQMMRIAVV
jgi:hypothetical protein